MNVYEAINNRTSIRKYQETKVEDEKLMRLAEAAINAPNAGNAQPWDFVFITDPSLIAKFTEILQEVHGEYFGKARKDNQDKDQLEKTISFYGRLIKAPVFVFACMNIRNQQLNKPYQEWTTTWAHHSVALAMGNLMLAAVEEGLGTCWLGTPSWKAEDIKALLNIPEHVEIVAMSPIGYPDTTPKPSPRLPIEEVVHFNGW